MGCASEILSRLGEVKPEHRGTITELTRAHLDRAWIAIECTLNQDNKEAIDRGT